MISIQQNLSELEKSHKLRTMALECYVAAIANMAHYAVDLDAAITAPHRLHLSNLGAELAEASPEALTESRSTLRGLLRDYRDRASTYLCGLRNQLSSTAQALREMVDGLAQCDTDHHGKTGAALVRLREIAGSPEGVPVRAPMEAAVSAVEQSLEQMRRQHRFTIAQMQTEIRLLHNRIDSLEAAASTDEASQMSNRRFLAEYLRATSAEGACFLILKMRGLAEARVRFGVGIADEVLATFGRRLRNTVPKEGVIGRWGEQDFLAIVPAAAKPSDGAIIKQFAGHLSMPYACMIEGKVVRVPMVVTAECMAFPPGTPADQIHSRVTEAFQS
jgi:GGDEF domain-containing protein